MSKSLTIGGVSLSGAAALAPMAGVSDLTFRETALSHGAAIACGEMVSAKALTMNNRATIFMLDTSESDRPSSVQLFGHEPSIMAEAASILNGFQFEILDINMGCPVPKIVKNGEGSALMRDARLAGSIVSAVVKASNKPVTVKIRKGIDGLNNAAYIAKIAEDAGAAAIAVHGRTREQFYEGEADWGVIADVKRAVKIPVFGNGDITSPESAADMIDRTGCDAVMIGRAAHGNPWVFRRVSAFLRCGELLPEPIAEEKINAAISHARALCARKGEYIGVREARGHMCAYIKGLPGAAKARAQICKAETEDELALILCGLIN